jgi:hypothetical protein
MRNKIISVEIAGAALLVLLVLLVIAAFLVPSLVFVFPINSALLVLTSFLASISGFYAASVYGFDNPHGKSLFYIAIGLLFWCLGELIWDVYEYIWQIAPYPSAADFAYLLAYPMFFIGLLNEIRVNRLNWKSLSLFSTALLVLVIISLTYLVLYFGIYLAYDRDSGLIENLVAMFYGVGDLILVFLSLFVFKLATEYKGGRLAYPWIYLMIAMLITLFVDVLFAKFTFEYEEGIWYFREFMDLFWNSAYLIFAYSLLTLGLIIRNISLPSKK